MMQMSQNVEFIKPQMNNSQLKMKAHQRVLMSFVLQERLATESQLTFSANTQKETSLALLINNIQLKEKVHFFTILAIKCKKYPSATF